MLKAAASLARHDDARHHRPLSTLFASPALRAAFAKGAELAGNAFLVPVDRPRAAALVAVQPRPWLTDGAAERALVTA